MWDAFGTAVSAVAVVGGLCGLVRPELLRSSLQETYTARSARLCAAVLLLLGLAGLYAMLVSVGPGEFFPA